MARKKEEKARPRLVHHVEQLGVGVALVDWLSSVRKRPFYQETHGNGHQTSIERRRAEKGTGSGLHLRKHVFLARTGKR